MVAMDAQHFDAMLVQLLFPTAITMLVAIVVHANITQNHNGVIGRDTKSFDHVGDPQSSAVDIASDIDHFALSPSGMECASNSSLRLLGS